MSKKKNKPPPTTLVDIVTHRGPEFQSPATHYPLTRVLCLYGYDTLESKDGLAMLYSVTGGHLVNGHPVEPIAFAKSIYRLKQGEQIEKLVLLGEHVLAETRDAIMWWRPAAVTPMWFKTTEPTALSALNGVPLPHPALLFKAGKREGSGLSVWALADNQRPTAETRLHRAPYMNLYPDGGVCLGTARDPSLTRLKKDGPATWERLFFESNFSHTPPPLNYGNCNKKTGDVAEQRKEKLEAYAAFLAHLRKEQARSVNLIYKNGCAVIDWSKYLIPSRTLKDVL